MKLSQKKKGDEKIFRKTLDTENFRCQFALAALPFKADLRNAAVAHIHGGPVLCVPTSELE